MTTATPTCYLVGVKLCPACPPPRASRLRGGERICDACAASSVAWCSCGAVHRTMEEWRALPLDQMLPADEKTRLEFRECTCGSLLVVTIDRNGNLLAKGCQ